jgi:hypothetical protein
MPWPVVRVGPGAGGHAQETRIGAKTRHWLRAVPAGGCQTPRLRKASGRQRRGARGRRAATVRSARVDVPVCDGLVAEVQAIDEEAWLASAGDLDPTYCDSRQDRPDPTHSTDARGAQLGHDRLPLRTGVPIWGSNAPSTISAAPPQCTGRIHSRIGAGLAAAPSLTRAKAGPRAPGSRMRRAGVRRADVTRCGHACSGWSSAAGRDRWVPGTSGPRTQRRRRQRPPRPRCLILCHPVSPVSQPGGTQRCSYYTSYYSARHAKGPLLGRKGP